MTLADDIMECIARRARTAAPVTASSNLYADLGYDSLAFVTLLVEVEERYAIEFQLEEMSRCLLAGRLFSLVEHKLKEAGRYPTPATKTEPPGPGPD